MKIYKYLLPYGSESYLEFSLTMPEEAKILSLQVQHDSPCLWATVPANAGNLIQRYFLIVGTDCDFSVGNYKYIGTYQLFNGDYVGHLFEKESNENKTSQ